MLIQDKSFTWNLGGTGHNLEFLLLNLWFHLLWGFFACTLPLANSSRWWLTTEEVTYIRALKCAVWLLTVMNYSHN